MREKKGLVTGLVIGLAVGAISLTAVGAGAVNTTEDRPFDGILGGTSTSTVSGGSVSSVSTGTLKANHMGKGTYEIRAGQDYARHANNEEHPDGDCAFVEDGTTTPGVTLTAANGDKVFGDIDDDRSEICVSEEAAGPGPDSAYLSTLYVDIVGGTGRFADATGWFFTRGESRLTGGNMMSATFDDSGVLMGNIDY